MSGERITVSAIRNEASEYMLRASYSVPSQREYDQNLIGYSEHQFSSQGLFPNLSEYSKASSADSVDFSSLSFKNGGRASLKLVETSGSFKNVLGHYQVDSDGTIHRVQIAVNDTRSKNTELTHQFNIDSGSSVHLFVVANGFALNKEFSDTHLDSGEFSFLYKLGENGERLAKVTDVADDITLVYQSEKGETKEIRGPVYHTTNDNAQNSINSDGHKHAVSGRIDENIDSVLRIGFEDFPGLGDADYNDIVVDLSVIHPALSNGDDGSNTVQDLVAPINENSEKPYDDSPLYDDRESGDSLFWGVNNSLNFDTALNDEIEDSINIDDVLIFEQNSIDDAVVSYLNSSNSMGEQQGNSGTDITSSIEIIASSADYDFSNLEIILDTVI